MLLKASASLPMLKAATVCAGLAAPTGSLGKDKVTKSEGNFADDVVSIVGYVKRTSRI